LSRGRRAWRSITAGLLVSRDVYGEHTNRWYCRGLPPADKKSWELKKVNRTKAYSRMSSPRAWKSGGLVLVPPEIWRMGRPDRRKVRELLRHARDPESVVALVNLVTAVSQKLPRQSTTIAAPQGRLTKEQVQAFYKGMAERKAASSVSGSGSEILPPLSEVGGYKSSVHTTSADPPKLLSEDDLLATGQSGDPVWMERERAKVRARGEREAAELAKNRLGIAQWLERVLKLSKRDDPDD
jgi:hypothetical protein